MPYLTDHLKQELHSTANTMITPGKGLLACDENTATIGKRLATIGMDNTTENGRLYRQLLFNCVYDNSMQKYFSGVILFHDTLFQKADSGVSFVNLLRDKGTVVGIKVDRGVVKLPGTDNETTTQGLDDLDERCKEYYDNGARFTKWRCSLRVGNGCPSQLAIQETASVLSRFASISQMNGLCPIVEPEILTDGDHDLEACMEATEKTLAAVYKALSDHKVYLEGTMLKCNMVLPGVQCKKKYTSEQIAAATVSVLQRTVPAAVPGVLFLSGGQSEIMATTHLDAINKYKATKPWALTYSFGRALQTSAMKAWGGKTENIPAAQKAFLHRAKSNSLAALGKYAGEDVTSTATENLFVEDFQY
jgi:fructose-bisphosphate aldolase class I